MTVRKALLNPSYFKSNHNFLKERTIRQCVSLIDPKISNQTFQSPTNSPRMIKIPPLYSSYSISSNQFQNHKFHSPKFIFPASLHMATQNRSYSSNSNSGSENWKELLDKAQHTLSSISSKTKEISDSLTPHINHLYESNPNLEKVVVPFASTFCGSVLAWFVMPVLFRRLHKYTSRNPILALLGGAANLEVPYKNSMWNSLEDPAKYLVTFIAFTQLGGIIAPSILPYLPQLYRGSAVVSLVWFLQRWKTNFLSSVLSSSPPLSVDRERLSALDKVSSLGLIMIGVMGLAEACGVAVQSILTVGGVGGVATAFAARDLLGNMLSGFSLQFSKPFSIGDNIKAGSIEGQVVDIGLTSTSLINPEKFPVIVPNSLFSSQVIVNKSRAQWRSSVTKIPVRIEDIEKIPSISEEIKAALRANPKVFLEKDAPYCYLSRLESSFGELTIGCNLKAMRRDELYKAEQEILIEAAGVIRKNGAEVGSTQQCC
ncbi:hypothetical protein LUZ60_016573 [Juncus effusus]|nr:hypothetical protein LUZ60_016573 [Juncus effusus]